MKLFFRFIIGSSIFLIGSMQAWYGIEFKDNYLRLSSRMWTHGAAKIFPSKALQRSLSPSLKQHILLESFWYNGEKKELVFKGSALITETEPYLSFLFDSAGTVLTSEYRIYAFTIDKETGLKDKPINTRDVIDFVSLGINKSNAQLKPLRNPNGKPVTYEPFNMSSSKWPTKRQILIAAGSLAAIGVATAAAIYIPHFIKKYKTAEEYYNAQSNNVAELENRVFELTSNVMSNAQLISDLKQSLKIKQQMIAAGITNETTADIEKAIAELTLKQGILENFLNEGKEGLETHLKALQELTKGFGGGGASMAVKMQHLQQTLNTIQALPASLRSLNKTAQATMMNANQLVDQSKIQLQKVDETIEKSQPTLDKVNKLLTEIEEYGALEVLSSGGTKGNVSTPVNIAGMRLVGGQKSPTLRNKP